MKNDSPDVCECCGAIRGGTKEFHDFIMEKVDEIKDNFACFGDAIRCGSGIYATFLMMAGYDEEQVTECFEEALSITLKSLKNRKGHQNDAN